MTTPPSSVKWLEPGDIILAFEGAAVTPASLIAKVGALPVGKSVVLKVLRKGKPLELRLALIEKPRDPGSDQYAVAYSDVTSHGHRMRTIITQPRTPGRHPALMFIQGFSPISYDYRLDGPGLDAPVDRRRVAAIARAVPEYLAGFADFSGVEPWAGLRPASPDGLPIIGRQPSGVESDRRHRARNARHDAGTRDGRVGGPHRLR